MLLDIITKLKLKIQIYIILFYCKYSFIFCCHKPFEEDLTIKKKNNKKVEVKKVEINNQNLEQKKNKIEKPVEKEVKKENEKPIKKAIQEKFVKNEDINNKPIENPIEEHIKEPVNNEKISNINKKLKDTLDSLKFPVISGNLEIYKNIFNDILKKCREKVLFLYDKNIFSNIKKGETYSNNYVKIDNFYDIINIDPEDNFKINGDEVNIEYFVETKDVKDFGTEIFIIKDPVYNFIYSIKCIIDSATEDKFLENNPKTLYFKNDGFKAKYIYKNKLYFYLNEEEENNKEKIQPSKYLIFFKYILSLLDESDVYCSRIANVKSDKFFIENKIKMEVLTSVGVNKKNPLKIDKNIKIIRGINNNN